MTVTTAETSLGRLVCKIFIIFCVKDLKTPLIEKKKKEKTNRKG